MLEAQIALTRSMVRACGWHLQLWRCGVTFLPSSGSSDPSWRSTKGSRLGLGCEKYIHGPSMCRKWCVRTQLPCLAILMSVLVAGPIFLFQTTAPRVLRFHRLAPLSVGSQQTRRRWGPISSLSLDHQDRSNRLSHISSHRADRKSYNLTS